MIRTVLGALTSSEAILAAIKAVHTIIWAVFVACIVAIWVFAWQADFFDAALSIGAVLGEVVVLVAFGWYCPLTLLAARYTDDRRANFDIYLPEWLARHNKVIFGTLYVAGIAVTCSRWVHAST
jgi:polyferredoxin